MAKVTAHDLQMALNGLQAKGLYFLHHLRIFADGSGSLRNGDERIVSWYSLRQGLEELTKLDKANSYSVRLNKEYTAEISEKGIVVGCQTIPLSVMPELVAAVEKVLKTSTPSRVGQEVRFCDVRIGEKVKFYENSPIYTRVEPKGSDEDETLTFDGGKKAWCAPNTVTLVEIVG